MVEENIFDKSRQPLLLSVHLCYEQGPVGECLYLLHVERVEYSLVFRPGDELEGRVGLDMAVDDATEVERQVLDGWGEHHAGRVWK